VEGHQDQDGVTPAAGPAQSACMGELAPEQVLLPKEHVAAQQDSPVGQLLAKLFCPQPKPAPPEKLPNLTKACNAASGAKKRAVLELGKAQKHLESLVEQVKEAKERVSEAATALQEAERVFQQALLNINQELGPKATEEGPKIEEIEEDLGNFDDNIEVDEEGDPELEKARQADQEAQQAVAKAKQAALESRKAMLAAINSSAKRRKELDLQGNLDLARSAAEHVEQAPPSG